MSVINLPSDLLEACPDACGPVEQWSLEIQQGLNLPCDEEPYLELSTAQAACINCADDEGLGVAGYFIWNRDITDVLAERCEWPIQTITREVTSGGGPQTFVDIEVIVRETTTETLARTVTYSEPISVDTETFTGPVPTWYSNADVTFPASGIHTNTWTVSYDPEIHSYPTESGWGPLETETADATASSSVAETTEAITSEATSEAASESTGAAASASESSDAGDEEAAARGASANMWLFGAVAVPMFAGLVGGM